MAKPFFKWAGGKAALVPQLLPLLPEDADERRHVEPFLGGGALFFAREPKTSLLADINHSLICTYIVTRDQTEYAIRSLKRLCREDTEESYYKRRERFNHQNLGGAAERAPLFLYLNKACFNGLYRENKAGGFNVPYGRYAKLTVDAEAIRAAAALLKSAVLWNTPFDIPLYSVTRTDFVYLDPPYDGGFTGYTSSGFGVAEQTLLARCFQVASDNGAKLMLSNSDTPLIRGLYKGFHITKLDAPRSIAANGKKRNSVSELVIRNYE